MFAERNGKRMRNLYITYFDDSKEKDTKTKDTEIKIPQDLLEEAGIAPNAPLEIYCDEGKVIISALNLLEQLPKGLPEVLEELGIDKRTLGQILEELEWGNSEREREELW